MGTLTDKGIKALAPRDKLFRVADGRGLTIEVHPNGRKYWRWRYRLGTRPQMLSVGVYPDVGLKAAREEVDELRRQLAAGQDPSLQRKRGKMAALRQTDQTFEAVANAWLDEMSKGWAKATEKKARYVVKQYLIPPLGPLDVSTLTGLEARQAVKACAARAPALAEKTRDYVGAIARYAISIGLREEGRFLSLDGALPRKRESGHFPAVTDEAELGAVVAAVERYPSPVVRAALMTCMLTALRPGTVAAMAWADVDLEKGEWSIPAELMKMRRAHITPLPTQLIEVLRQIGVFTGGRGYVFPALSMQKTPHVHRDTLSKALRSMGFAGKHATHGFRASFRTLGREVLDIPEDVLETQLAHVKKGEINKAYDRTRFLDKRREAMRRWADYIFGLVGTHESHQGG